MLCYILNSIFNVITDLIIPIIISIMNTLLVVFVSKRFFQAFQLSRYKTKEFFGWFKNTRARYMCRLFMVSLLSILLLMLSNILFGFLDEGLDVDVISSFSLIFYIVFMIMFIYSDRKQPSKTPLVYTPRMRRLVSIYVILTFIITAAFIQISDIIFAYRKFIFLRYAFICLTPLLSPFVMLLASYIVAPFETMNNKRYIKKATKVLQDNKDLVTIGITGSYGKTSVKDILYTFLHDECLVVKTKESYNTPLGVTMSILKDVDEYTKVFIVEMGARRMGDIKYLTNMVKPNIGILTGVTNQHIKTFKTLENIKSEKSELIKGLSKDKFAVFNLESEHVKDIYDKSNLENKKGISLDTGYIHAEDIVSGREGSSFTLCVGEDKYKVNTKLLGRHNILNILLCVEVALYLKVSIDKIIAKIPTLQPTPHRLEMIKNGSLSIIDDSYNSNPVGSEFALEVLNYFDHKVIVTPGFIELGDKAKEENYKFGKNISKVCDYAILVGKIQTEDILHGLIDSGYSEDNIFVAIDLEDAKKKLKDVVKSNSAILFENDLPDNYNEVV